MKRLGCALVAVVLCGDVWVAAQGQGQAPPTPDLAQVVAAATPGEPALLTYNNRPITELRATVFSRPPRDRASTVVGILDGIVANDRPGPVSTQFLAGAAVIRVGDRPLLAILPLDVDQLAGETVESKAALAVSRLQVALDEAVELRTPRRLVASALRSLGMTLVLGLLIYVTWRFHRVFGKRLLDDTERRLQRLSSGGSSLIRASRVSEFLKGAVTVVAAGVMFVLVYSWLFYVLRQFPYTRPWGESLRQFLFDRLSRIGLGIVNSMPDLFTVLVILVITRFAVRLAQRIFQAAEDERVSIPYVYPETAQPTRRLVTTIIWLLGLVLAYPYLPGSESEAFKGVSVFVGLIISLGSSGIVNQMMSGLSITYSRALRQGDFARIGDVEGTVTHLGSLSTKVKTPRGEEVTIPNAIVMGQVTTNYSRSGGTDGVYVSTSVTIGYDTPWRQVQALLLLAAERTEGVRKTPAPVVRQTALEDFYVKYTLLVSLEQPHVRLQVLDRLHGNIQDAFNEYGVQIMSPNYEADPENRKVVDKEQWFAAPAKPSARLEGV
jgi:small-conductance mechanosensitive channel